MFEISWVSGWRPHEEGSLLGALGTVGVLGAWGMGVAIMFWLIARPDRLDKPETVAIAPMPVGEATVETSHRIRRSPKSDAHREA
jgi:hypothetical protein